MLDMEPISLHSHDNSRPGGCGSDEFVILGLYIVNMALAGCMDSKTVRAFLNYYGYTNGVVRDPLERESDPKDGLRASGMNGGLLNRALEQAEGHSPDSNDRIQLRSPSSLSAASSAPSTHTDGLEDALSEDSTGLGDAVPGNPDLQGALPEDTPGLQGALPEDTSGPQDALPENAPGPQDVLAENTPGLQDALPENTPSLQDALPENTPSLQDALSEFQNQHSEELWQRSEQSPAKTTSLQAASKVLQTTGGAHTDNTGSEDFYSKIRIQQFLDQAHGATLEQAKIFLEVAGEDVEQALLDFGLYQSKL